MFGLSESVAAAAAMYISDRIYINYIGWRSRIFLFEKYGGLADVKSEDMADEEGITRAEARDAILNSDAYEDLYNFDTRLWMEGPDYFRAYYQKTKEAAR